MKKLLILFIVLFLSSCSRGDVELINVYFTTGGSLPDELSYTNKFSNFTDYSIALESDLEYGIRDYEDYFDEEFFNEHDLIIVLFYSGWSYSCSDFSLDSVRIKNDQLNITVSRHDNRDPLTPQPTAIQLYGYLIVIDKTDITNVELIFD